MVQDVDNMSEMALLMITGAFGNSCRITHGKQVKADQHVSGYYL